MALSKTEHDWRRANLLIDDDKKVVWNVIGLHGSYHGDTIGAMDLSSPNVYNERVHW